MTDGILLIDKPAGKTSHDIVAAVRREHRGRRVGHAGTLDPFATGLLLVLIGRATRIQRYLMALPKSYETVARLGWTSTTGDPEGEIVHTGRVPPDPPALPTGELLQRPPAYSAVKVDGRRAYERARAGEEVVIAERPVTVHRFEQLWREDDRAAFAIECSAGTYVRTLISELGDAYCTELRRTAIGPFSVADADPERLAAAGGQRWASCRPCASTVTTRPARRTASPSGGLTGADAATVLLRRRRRPDRRRRAAGRAWKPVVGFRA